MSLRISWLVPTPFESSGGHRNIFRAVRYLSDFGHQVTVYLDPGTRFQNEAQLEAFIEQHFFGLRARITKGLENSIKDDCDALVATHFSTAYIARANQSCRQKFYFIQDYEPLFFPMGTEYLMAENTYRMGFIGITSGPWCSKIVRERYGMEADYFLFPVDRSVYYPRPAQHRRVQRVLFFARPEMPRRCYAMGIEALKILHQRLPEVEIVLYGSRQIASNGVGFPCQNLGILTTLDDLARLYSNADVGIAFSTTNPSLVPYEMMACGLPVIDFDLPDSDLHYGSRENVWLVAPEPNAVAEGISLLLCDEGLRTRLAKNGLRFVESFPDEEQMARRIESLIVRGLLGIKASDLPTQPARTKITQTVEPRRSTIIPMSSEEIKRAILERLVERRRWAEEITQRVETLERQIVEVKSTLRMHHDVVLDYVHSTTLRILFFPARIYRILRRLLHAAWIRLGGSKGAS